MFLKYANTARHCKQGACHLRALRNRRGAGPGAVGHLVHVAPGAAGTGKGCAGFALGSTPSSSCGSEWDNVCFEQNHCCNLSRMSAALSVSV